MKKKFYIYLWFLTCSIALFSNPQGMKIVAGDASINKTGADGSLLNITASDKTILSWDKFSIQVGEKTHFALPSVNASILNRVTGNEKSSILGTLTSNGNVYLINPFGMIIGKDAFINAASFTASTLDIIDKSFLEMKELSFRGESKEAIVNFGTIEAFDTDVVLLGRYIKNEGKIKAKEDVCIAACKEVLYKPSSREKIYIKRSLPDEKSDEIGIENTGEIEALNAYLQADGSLYSLAIKDEGKIDALSFAEEDGNIFLIAEDSKIILNNSSYKAKRKDIGGEVRVLSKEVNLLGHTTIDASSNGEGGIVLIGGDYQGNNPDIYNADFVFTAPEVNVFAHSEIEGNGGKVIFWANEAQTFLGNVNVRAGKEIGDGGFVEVSAKNLLFDGIADRTASNGKVGELLLDPIDITISNAPTVGVQPTIPAPTTYYPVAAGANINIVSVLQPALALGDVRVQAYPPADPNDIGNVLVNNDVIWGANKLTLIGRNVDLNANITGVEFEIQASENIDINNTLINCSSNVTFTKISDSLPNVNFNGSASLSSLTMSGGKLAINCNNLYLNGDQGSQIDLLSNAFCAINANNINISAVNQDNYIHSVDGEISINYQNNLQIKGSIATPNAANIQSTNGDIYINQSQISSSLLIESNQGPAEISSTGTKIGIYNTGAVSLFSVADQDCRIQTTGILEMDAIGAMALSAQGTGDVYINADQGINASALNKLELIPRLSDVYITVSDNADLKFNSSSFPGASYLYINKDKYANKAYISGGLNSNIECHFLGNSLISAGSSLTKDTYAGIFTNQGNINSTFINLLIEGGNGAQISYAGISSGYNAGAFTGSGDVTVLCRDLTLKAGSGSSGAYAHNAEISSGSGGGAIIVNALGDINLTGGSNTDCAAYIESKKSLAGAFNSDIHIEGSSLILTSGTATGSEAAIKTNVETFITTIKTTSSSDGVSMSANQAPTYIQYLSTFDSKKLTMTSVGDSVSIDTIDGATFSIDGPLVMTGSATTPATEVDITSRGAISFTKVNSIRMDAKSSNAYIRSTSGKNININSPNAFFSSELGAPGSGGLTLIGGTGFAIIETAAGGDIDIHFAGDSSITGGSSAGDGYAGIFTGHTSGSGNINASFGSLTMTGGSSTGNNIAAIASGFVDGNGNITVSSNNLKITGGSGSGTTLAGIYSGYRSNGNDGSGDVTIRSNALELTGGSGTGGANRHNAEISAGSLGGEVTAIWINGDVSLLGGSGSSCSAYIQSRAVAAGNNVTVSADSISITGGSATGAEAAIRTASINNYVRVATLYDKDITITSNIAKAYIEYLSELISRNNLIIQSGREDAYIECYPGATFTVEDTTELLGSNNINGDSYISSSDTFSITSGAIVMQGGLAGPSYIESTNGNLFIKTNKADIHLETLLFPAYIEALNGTVSIDIKGSVELEGSFAAASITGEEFSTFVAGYDVVLLSNAQINHTGNDSFAIQAGNDVILTDGGKILNDAGDLIIEAGADIFLQNSSAITNVSTDNLTLVVDNNYPTSPTLGHGGFIKDASSQVNTAAGGKVRIFTSERLFNSIAGDINTVAYVPGSFGEDTNFERYGIYYPSTFFGGPGYTIFYKNKDIENILYHSLGRFSPAVSELFYRLNNMKIGFYIINDFDRSIKRAKTFCRKNKIERYKEISNKKCYLNKLYIK